MFYQRRVASLSFLDRLNHRQDIFEAAKGLTHSFAPPLLAFNALALDHRPHRFRGCLIGVVFFGNIRPDGRAEALSLRNSGTSRGNKRVEPGRVHACA